MDYSVALWNVRGCTTGDTNTNALTEEKVAWLQTQLVTWQADIMDMSTRGGRASHALLTVDVGTRRVWGELMRGRSS